MDNIFIIALIISVVFTLGKLFEMKFLLEEDKKPIKYLIRDSLFVYLSVIISFFIINQISPNISKFNKEPLLAFLSEPEF